MNQSELLKLLAEAGALVTQSHIVYTSGKHGDSYVNKDAIYPHTSLTAKLCEKIAENFLSEAIDVVVSPAVGAIILSQWTSHFLSALSPKEVLAVYAEKDGAGFVIKRGYEKLLPQRRVLVVEDVLTTGGSVKKVVEVCRTLGGTVVGVAALCNRGSVTAQTLGDVPKLFSLIDVDLSAWDAGDCPLCRQHVPINQSVGKGREFLAKGPA